MTVIANIEKMPQQKNIIVDLSTCRVSNAMFYSELVVISIACAMEYKFAHWQVAVDNH